MKKFCKSCKQEKPLNEFTPHKGHKDGYRNKCLNCHNLYIKDWRSANPSKKYHLKDRYGLSYDQYFIMLVEQNYQCKICSIHNDVKKLGVDHCHSTGRVRGLICQDCNFSLGRMQDSVERLQNAINYLNSTLESKTIADVLKSAYNRGWISKKDGNISLRKDNKLFITKSGVDKSNIQHSEILEAHIKNEEIVFNDKMSKPSGELEMHRMLQEVDFKGVRAVVHLHPTYTIAAMHRGFDLQKLAAQFPEVSRYTKVGPMVPVVPVTSKELADATFKAMTEYVSPNGEDNYELIYDIVGQAGHGVCAIGQNPWDAFEHIERLEHICQIVLASGVDPE